MNNRYREEESIEVAVTESDSEEATEVDVDTEVVNEQGKRSKKKEKKIDKEENEVLRDKLEELQAEVAKIKDQYLRNLAETENYKKRLDEEKIRERKYGSQRLLEKLVGVTDIFDKACNVKTEDPMLKNFLIGFQMLNTNIQSILEDEGVKKIKVEAMFDPKFQYAMETDYDETKEEGAILAILKDGYMYKDRVLVAAMVKVNKKPDEKEENKEE